LVAFFALREIFLQFKGGGGAWPKWPNGKYAHDYVRWGHNKIVRYLR